MYKSIHRMYNSWPDDTRIYVGHDYPPSDRPVSQPSLYSILFTNTILFSIAWLNLLKRTRSLTR